MCKYQYNKANLNNLQLIEIEFDSNRYHELLNFRYILLRQPLGLLLSRLDIEDEDKQFHFAAIIDSKIIGCVLLKPVSEKIIKLRQMAISPEYQGTGIGKALVDFSLKKACMIGFEKVECHSRITAQKFYQKLGFKTMGDEFIEVTVPTIRTEKLLTTERRIEGSLRLNLL